MSCGAHSPRHTHNRLPRTRWRAAGKGNVGGGGGGGGGSSDGDSSSDSDDSDGGGGIRRIRKRNRQSSSDDDSDFSDDDSDDDDTDSDEDSDEDSNTDCDSDDEEYVGTKKRRTKVAFKKQKTLSSSSSSSLSSSSSASAVADLSATDKASMAAAKLDVMRQVYVVGEMAAMLHESGVKEEMDAAATLEVHLRRPEVRDLEALGVAFNAMYAEDGELFKNLEDDTDKLVLAVAKIADSTKTTASKRSTKGLDMTDFNASSSRSILTALQLHNSILQYVQQLVCSLILTIHE